VLLLATTGRRSGHRHVTPLLFHRDDDGSLLLIAANGAADWDPDWFLKLLADPHVHVEIDGVVHPGSATVVAGDDRTTAWPSAVHAFPGLTAADGTSTRDAPVIRVDVD
jgi:deazaflavin-dependent oxidoreductase (nitroreductase family)